MLRRAATISSLLMILRTIQSQNIFWANYTPTGWSISLSLLFYSSPGLVDRQTDTVVIEPSNACISVSRPSSSVFMTVIDDDRYDSIPNCIFKSLNKRKMNLLKTLN